MTGKCLLTLVIALQKLLSECQSYRDCQLPVNHLLFGKDPCPGTTKYLHVNYKCKPSEFSSSAPVCSSLLCLHQFLSHLRWGWVGVDTATQPHTKNPTMVPLTSSCFPLHSAEHKRHVACEGEAMVLRCKPPRVLNIYAAVYGRGLGESDTCPSHLTRPPPFGESTGCP